MAVSATAHAQSARLVLMRPEVLTASCPWQGCDPGPARLTRYDAATGSVLPEREYPIDPWDFEFVRRLDLDPHTGRGVRGGWGGLSDASPETVVTVP